MAAPENAYALGLNQIGYATVVVNIFFVIFSTVIVGLRIATRRMLRNKLWWDDWLIIAAAIVFIGFCANALVGIHAFGGGQVYKDAKKMHKQVARYKQSEVALSIMYAFNVTLIKCSILAFYHRIFAVASFRRINFIVGIICLLWVAASFVTDLLYCVPLRRYWDPTVEGVCYNFNLYFIIVEIFDLVMDAVLIVLPLKTIANLHLSLRKRLALLAVFSCGAFVVLTGALRIGYVYRPDVTIEFLTLASLWSTVHLGVAMLCACLPVFRPWIPKIGTFVSSVRSRYGSSDNQSTMPYSDHSDIEMVKPSPTYQKVNDSSLASQDMNECPNSALSEIHITGGGMHWSGRSLDGIRVQRHVEVS